MGPELTFLLKLADTVKWPVAAVVGLYLLLTKGEALFSLLEGATIRIRRKGLTIEILPPIRELPRAQDLLSERRPEERKRAK